MSKKLTAEERLSRQQARDAARKEAREKMQANRVKSNGGLSADVRDLISKEVGKVINTVYKECLKEQSEQLLEQFKLQIPRATGGYRIHDRVYCKFSCEQLLAIFGGWFTLKYAFSSKYTNADGTDGETDFYICSQDVSLVKQNERPPLNEPLYKAFGIKVYGFAIIAPSTAF